MSGLTKLWAPIPPADPDAPGYDELRRRFHWADARAVMAGLPGGGLNIGHEAVDRHCADGRGHRTALRCVQADGTVDELSYEQLRRDTNRLAHVLTRLGVRRGDRVATLLGRRREQYVAAIGTLKAGAVFTPLFSSFGPEPVRDRLALSSARVLVTTSTLYRRKVAPARAALTGLAHVLLVDDEDDGTALPWTAALEHADDEFPVASTRDEDMALLHFTSGTTGRPKGAVHVHEAVVAHASTATFALDLRADDVFWCTADPGWVTGTSYGIVAPLVRGATILTYAGEFDAPTWYRLLAEHHVNVWYTAPTALRMLARHGAELPRGYDLRALRHIASVGEALNPEIVTWAEEAYGMPVHDNWWQTETGAIMIGNYPGMEIRPGSMGRPLPGIDAAVLLRDEHDEVVVRDGAAVPAPPGRTGELALRPGWPSMLRGYLGDDERYRRCFVGGWYRSGDLAEVDEDGYFWFVGRGDDVIKSAGHLIGPFEVESALMEHAAVAEAGVIGKPDPVAGEVVKAFVTLRPGWEPDDDVRGQLLAFARRRLGGLAPKEIDFDPHLPHTSSGKVMRRLLKARELGRAAGDLSTLEPAP
jgi:acetyl-CoA synthetase